MWWRKPSKDEELQRLRTTELQLKCSLIFLRHMRRETGQEVDRRERSVASAISFIERLDVWIAQQEARKDSIAGLVSGLPKRTCALAWRTDTG